MPCFESLQSELINTGSSEGAASKAGARALSSLRVQLTIGDLTLPRVESNGLCMTIGHSGLTVFLSLWEGKGNKPLQSSAYGPGIDQPTASLLKHCEVGLTRVIWQVRNTEALRWWSALVKVSLLVWRWQGPLSVPSATAYPGEKMRSWRRQWQVSKE